MNWLVVLPVIVPFATAAVTLCLRNHLRLQGRAAISGAVVHFVVCMFLLARVAKNGIVTVHIG